VAESVADPGMEFVGVDVRVAPGPGVGGEARGGEGVPPEGGEGGPSQAGGAWYDTDTRETPESCDRSKPENMHSPAST
jgi:hypothetical protein